MGEKCSCLRSYEKDSKDFSIENSNTIKRSQLEDLPLKSFNIPDQMLTCAKGVVTLSELITLQSVLRGYLDRRRSSKIWSTLLLSQKSIFKHSSNQTRSTELLITARSSKKIENFQYHFPESEEVQVSKKPQVQMEDKAVYAGEWNSLNQRHGKGVQMWPDGTRYDGHWVFGKMNGKGRMIFPDGSVYQGHWANNLQEGFGKLTKTSGSFYEGEWSRNKPHGTGVEKTSNNDLYQGNFWNGRKSGHGVQTWNDGRTYHGHWINGILHGSGVFVWDDKRSFTGNYTDDLKNGFGVFRWPDGRVYKGMWLDGKQHGLGVYTTHKGYTRAGEWNEGKRIRWID